jgi:hypothetical protein
MANLFRSNWEQIRGNLKWDIIKTSLLLIPFGSGAGMLLGVVKHRSAEVVALWMAIAVVLAEIIAVFAVILYELIAPKANIMFYQADYGKIGYDKDKGVFSWALEHKYFHLLIKVVNEAHATKQGKNLERVKAQVTFKYKEEYQRYNYSPGTWVDEECNSVDLSVGDSRYLVLAIGSNYKEWWHTIINRRDSTDKLVSLQWNDIPPMIGDADIEINLVCGRHTVKTMLCGLKWDWGESRPYLTYFKNPQN